jgi:hypothetical protein
VQRVEYFVLCTSRYCRYALNLSVLWLPAVSTRFCLCPFSWPLYLGFTSVLHAYVFIIKNTQISFSICEQICNQMMLFRHEAPWINKDVWEYNSALVTFSDPVSVMDIVPSGQFKSVSSCYLLLRSSIRLNFIMFSDLLLQSCFFILLHETGVRFSIRS